LTPSPRRRFFGGAVWLVILATEWYPAEGAIVLLRKLVFCLLVVLAAPIVARADPPQPVPADGQCTVPADPGWTRQEQFVWLRICAGKEANFNKEPEYGGNLDPKSAALPDSRILRPSFLETILLADKYRNALTRLGVHIYGARFTDPVDLRNADFSHDLWINGSLLEKGANLESLRSSRRVAFDDSKIVGAFDASRMRTDQDFSMHQAVLVGNLSLVRAYVGNELDLSGTTVSGTVDMNTIDVGRTLYMGNKAHFNAINLVVAHIGQVDLSGSTVTGYLNMDGIRVDQYLFMRNKAQFAAIGLFAARIGSGLQLNSSTVTGLLNMNGIQVDLDVEMKDKATFKTVTVVAAHIGGSLYLNDATIDGELNLNRASTGNQLNLIGSTVTGLLNLNSVRVGQNLHMENKAHFAEINLVGGHVSGQFNVNGSTVSGKLQGNYINVEQAAFLGATFDDQIVLVSAKFGQDLSLSGGVFKNNVYLTGAQIAGVLGLEKAKWLDDAQLFLDDGSAGGIDLSDSWPDNIFLNSFTYRNLSHLDKYNSEQAATWFGKQAYAPQPYEQLATVLQANGSIDDATDIRYAGKDREYQAATGLRRVWLFLLKYSIGFGYHLEYAFAWALGFVLLGWGVLYATGQRNKHGMTLGLTYSFDMLLPLVQLDKKHDDIDLDPWPRRYFYAHKLVGVLLTSFIVAGISGLTK
jgi:hypothetical protein